jgi:glutathione synthase/RimK-type ligase-like ATP-grasp enzyme
MTEQDWDAVVVKPTVSASAFETKLLMLTQAVSSQEWFRQLLSRRNVIVQKFMPEIMSAGEISIIYFNKQYSHAVCKLPQKGDFRVQDELGGSYHSIVPDNRVVKWGRDILERVGHPLLYARVDAVMITREPVLTELELIEPDLYLDTSQGGIDNFVEAIRKWGHIDD